jgi:hypothetical protein
LDEEVEDDRLDRGKKRRARGDEDEEDKPANLQWSTVRVSVVLGALLLIFGLLGTLNYWSMDTTVAVEPVNFMGERIGGGRVHNIGLMEERRNGLLVSIAAAGLGFALVAIGSRR